MAKFKANKGYHLSKDGKPWAHFKPRHEAGVGTVYEFETDDKSVIGQLEKLPDEYGVQQLPDPEPVDADTASGA